MSAPFVHRLRVRYSECDAQSAVFNANYLTYFDIAMTELWREVVGGYEQMTATGVDMVVAEATIRYLAPARFDDELEIRAEVLRLGTTGITTRLTVERAGERLTEGTLRHVFIAAASGRKAPIPDAVRRGLAAYLAPDVDAAAHDPGAPAGAAPAAGRHAPS